MNVLYIHTHDTGRMIEPYGYAMVTPNLKEFTRDATMFRQAYCVSPTCSPSRASMLTGVYPHQCGMLGLAQRGFQMDMKKHIVNYLKLYGFTTALCGIQHESGWYLDHEEGATAIGYSEDLTCDSAGYTQEELPQWDAKNAETAAKWIAEHEGTQPFFLSYGMHSTHRRYPSEVAKEIDALYVKPPYPIPDSPETRLDHARFMTSAKSADQCIGTVLEALKQKGIYDDTIILFTTDHGLANPYSKCTLFDSGIGVSLIMRVPHTDAIGKTVEGLVSHLDVFPTLCDLLGVEKPDYLEGRSFSPCFEDVEYHVRDEIFAEVNFHTSYEPIRCIRSERYKYIKYFDEKYLNINRSNYDESPSKDFFANHDLNERMKDGEALYDLVYDMGERNNLIDDPAAGQILEDMRGRLNRIMTKTSDPLLAGEIPRGVAWKVNKRECEMAGSKDPGDYECLGRIAEYRHE